MFNSFTHSIFAAQAAEPVSAGAAIGASILILVLGILIYLCISGLFIHVAAGTLKLGGTFGTAVSAALWQILFSFLFGIALSLLAVVVFPLAPAAPFVASWLGITMGIKQAYRCEFLQALLTGVLAWVFAVIAMTALIFVLVVAGLFSLNNLPKTLQPEAMPPSGVEWRMAPEPRETSLRVA